MPKAWSTRSTPSAKGSPFPSMSFARCSPRRRPWAAGQAACRTTVRPRRRGFRGRAWGAVGGSSGISVRRDGIAAMAKAGTVAVILPGAFYTLRETKAAAHRRLARRWRADGGGDRLQPRLLAPRLADLAMNMACTLFRMTPEEALLGTTSPCRPRPWPDRPRPHRPRPSRRSLPLGSRPPGELSYRIGSTPLHSRIFGGRLDA
jgi:imidazolonepropionase